MGTPCCSLVQCPERRGHRHLRGLHRKRALLEDHTAALTEQIHIAAENSILARLQLLAEVFAFLRLKGLPSCGPHDKLVQREVLALHKLRWSTCKGLRRSQTQVRDEPGIAILPAERDHHVQLQLRTSCTDTTRGTVPASEAHREQAGRGRRRQERRRLRAAAMLTRTRGRQSSCASVWWFVIVAVLCSLACGCESEEVRH